MSDNVQLNRFVPDLSGFIRASDVSVSMSGYNTSVELMQERKRAVVLPLLSDPEQVYRAGILRDLMGSSVVRYDNISLSLLLQRIRFQMESSIKPDVKDEWFGGLKALGENL
jgi:predicted glycosyltransferase